MNLNSKYFDSIRIDSKRQKRAAKDSQSSKRAFPDCQWKGCDKKGRHKAPIGRGAEGEYYHFCIDHVRQYNATYNYFDGMSDKDVAKFHKESITGHRPTWKLGDNVAAKGKDGAKGFTKANLKDAPKNDPHGFFAWREKQQGKQPKKTQTRRLRPLERKSLKVLHLDASATKDDIKARYKELVKQHHPDANGGDSAFEEKLREIIQAYNQLKQAGLV